MKIRYSTTAKVFFSVGSIMCVWVGASIINALSSLGWSFSELGRQYMVASGMIKPLHTLVDFYTHIKGIEYLICVAFFVAFPVFYQYINKEQKKRPTTR